MEEIAAVLECSPGTVKSRLFHAKAALRRILEKTP
jgi:DNA-directed RNA polymerase specialized sigma24 family protein